MAQNFGENPFLNNQLAQGLGYAGDFGGGQFQGWLSHQSPYLSQKAADLMGNFNQRDWGANPYMNQQLALGTGYGGNFGGGQYQNWLSGQSPYLQQKSNDLQGIGPSEYQPPTPSPPQMNPSDPFANSFTPTSPWSGNIPPNTPGPSQNYGPSGLAQFGQGLNAFDQKEHYDPFGSLQQPFDPRATLAQFGKANDTELAHVNPWEKDLLKSLGGSGTKNPYTGLMEYTNYGLNPELNKYLAQVTGYTGDFGSGGLNQFAQQGGLDVAGLTNTFKNAPYITNRQIFPNTPIPDEVKGWDIARLDPGRDMISPATLKYYGFAGNNEEMNPGGAAGIFAVNPDPTKPFDLRKLAGVNDYRSATGDNPFLKFMYGTDQASNQHTLYPESPDPSINPLTGEKYRHETLNVMNEISKYQYPTSSTARFNELTSPWVKTGTIAGLAAMTGGAAGAAFGGAGAAGGAGLGAAEGFGAGALAGGFDAAALGLTEAELAAMIASVEATGGAGGVGTGLAAGGGGLLAGEIGVAGTGAGAGAGTIAPITTIPAASTGGFTLGNALTGAGLASTVAGAAGVLPNSGGSGEDTWGNTPELDPGMDTGDGTAINPILKALGLTGTGTSGLNLGTLVALLAGGGASLLGANDQRQANADLTRQNLANWQQYAFPNAEKMGAMTSKGMSDIQRRYANSADSIYEQSAARGLGGNIVGSQIGQMEQAKNRDFANLSRDMTSFANTPYGPPPVTTQPSATGLSSIADMIKGLGGTYAGYDFAKNMYGNQNTGNDALTQALLAYLSRQGG